MGHVLWGQLVSLFGHVNGVRKLTSQSLNFAKSAGIVLTLIDMLFANISGVCLDSIPRTVTENFHILCLSILSFSNSIFFLVYCCTCDFDQLIILLPSYGGADCSWCSETTAAEKSVRAHINIFPGIVVGVFAGGDLFCLSVCAAGYSNPCASHECFVALEFRCGAV